MLVERKHSITGRGIERPLQKRAAKKPLKGSSFGPKKECVFLSFLPGSFRALHPHVTMEVHVLVNQNWKCSRVTARLKSQHCLILTTRVMLVSLEIWVLEYGREYDVSVLVNILIRTRA